MKLKEISLLMHHPILQDQVQALQGAFRERDSRAAYIDTPVDPQLKSFRSRFATAARDKAPVDDCRAISIREMTVKTPQQLLEEEAKNVPQNAPEHCPVSLSASNTYARTAAMAD